MNDKGSKTSKIIWKSIARKLLIVSILMMVTLIFINFYVKASVSERIITADQALLIEADCILVLGAGVYSSGRPSAMLEDRLLQGINLYEMGASNRLLFSGDHGTKTYDEVNTMKAYAINKGIPSEHIFMDHAGFSTYESMFRGRDIFLADRIIIVTQEYHLYRALYIAKQLGLDAYGVPSNQREYLGQSRRDFREFLARVKDFFYVIIQPDPTFLGDTIPISGSGDLTND